MKSVFGYLRVSSAGQGDEEKRDGFPRQERAIRAYAKANNLHIVKWYKDAHTGAKDLEGRPEFWRMMEDLKGGHIKTVVVEKLDRLARAVVIQESIVADFMRHEWALLSTCEPDLLSTDPTRIAFRQIMAVFAQYERSMIVLKLRSARQRCKATRPGWKEGRKFVGELPEHQATVKLIQRLRSEGLSLTAIAQALDKREIAPPSATNWHASTVRNVLKRHGTTIPVVNVDCGASQPPETPSLNR